MKSLSRVRLLATPWTAAYQAPPSMGFSMQEYWSGCHCLLWLYSAATHNQEVMQNPELLPEEQTAHNPHRAPWLWRLAPERWAPKMSGFKAQGHDTRGVWHTKERFSKGLCVASQAPGPSAEAAPWKHPGFMWETHFLVLKRRQKGQGPAGMLPRDGDWWTSSSCSLPSSVWWPSF